MADSLAWAEVAIKDAQLAEYRKEFAALKQKHAALREAASNVYSAWIYCWTESETNGAMKVLAAALWPEKESDEDWTRVNTVRDHRPWP